MKNVSKVKAVVFEQRKKDAKKEKNKINNDDKPKQNKQNNINKNKFENKIKKNTVADATPKETVKKNKLKESLNTNQIIGFAGAVLATLIAIKYALTSKTEVKPEPATGIEFVAEEALKNIPIKVRYRLSLDFNLW